MKQLFSILLLMVTIIATMTTVNAKTTKRSIKATTSQRVKIAKDGAAQLDYDTFFKDDGSTELKNKEEIKSSLINAGFKLVSSSDCLKFSCNGTMINISVFRDSNWKELDIKFKSKKTQESFVSKMERSGFKYQYETRSGIDYYGMNNVIMIVEGKDVNLIIEN